MNPIAIEQDKEYPQMYRLKWADDVLSEDFYNLTRAKDILRNYASYRDGMRRRGRKTNRMPLASPEKAAGEFKQVTLYHPSLNI